MIQRQNPGSHGSLSCSCSYTIKGHRHSVALFFGGIVAAGLFALPVVNLIAPVIVTMAMVHSFHRWRS
jgi:uncharacterized protein involved in cysteine biosynthesis